MTARSTPPNPFSGVSEVTRPASPLFEPANVSGDIVYAGDLPWLPFIEDVDHPPLELLSEGWCAVMAARPDRVIWGDPFASRSDYDDKLAVG